MAARLHATVEEAQQRVSSEEFVEWTAFLDEIEPNLNHREDFYLAQIAYRIALAQTSNPQNLKIEDFLIKFKRDDEVDEILSRDDLSDEEKKRLKSEKSKAVWLMGVGVGKTT